jgi:hypothetical protein
MFLPHKTATLGGFFVPVKLIFPIVLEAVSQYTDFIERKPTIKKMDRET